MTYSEFVYKVQRKIYGYYFRIIQNDDYNKYCRYYKSYRHSLSHETRKRNINYFSARPNPGAGIGHQIANWVAGYYYAKMFDLKFAHIPFSRYHAPFIPDNWDLFLGFGLGEENYFQLIKNGYKKVLLPIFDGKQKLQKDLINDIIKSYQDEKVIFLCEQDEFLKDQYLVADILKEKFYNAPARSSDKTIYDNNNFNIAVHVRRGDIMIDPDNPGLAMRYLSNDYYYNVLKQVISLLNVNKPINIYFFSQGTSDDYPEFAKFDNLHWCLDMNAQQSFLHFVYADLLITSKSSFSYKPALINNGIKVCPRNFWHGYPDSKEWILCENDGIINEKELLKFNR